MLSKSFDVWLAGRQDPCHTLFSHTQENQPTLLSIIVVVWTYFYVGSVSQRCFPVFLRLQICENKLQSRPKMSEINRPTAQKHALSHIVCRGCSFPISISTLARAEV